MNREILKMKSKSFLTWLFGSRETKCQYIWKIVDASYINPQQGHVKNASNGLLGLYSKELPTFILNVKHVGR